MFQHLIVICKIFWDQQMKELGEEHNLIIMQELIPSSIFGSSLFNLYSYWGSLDHISSKTFLQEETSSSWFPGHFLRLSQFNILSRPPPFLFFPATVWQRSCFFTPNQWLACYEWEKTDSVVSLLTSKISVFSFLNFGKTVMPILRYQGQLFSP